jgi:hypothetical protein
MQTPNLPAEGRLEGGQLLLAALHGATRRHDYEAWCWAVAFAANLKPFFDPASDGLSTTRRAAALAQQSWPDASCLAFLMRWTDSPVQEVINRPVLHATGQNLVLYARAQRDRQLPGTLRACYPAAVALAPLAVILTEPRWSRQVGRLAAAGPIACDIAATLAEDLRRNGGRKALRDTRAAAQVVVDTAITLTDTCRSYRTDC